MRRGLVYATDVLAPLVQLSQDAERAGFNRVWTTEYRGRDAIARALAIALATDRIEVGTGVAYAFTRLPLAMAALASDVHRLSRGRFGLGLSPGTRGVRRWFGAEFEPPAPALTAYVRELHDHWEAEKDAERPRVYLPAFNPIMTRHASTVADGLLLHPLAVGQTHFNERVLPAIARGVADRDTRPDLIAWQVVSIDDDAEKARERASAQLAFYFSTPSYKTAVENTVWEQVPDALVAAFKAGDTRNPNWLELGTFIPEDMVDEFTVWGTPTELNDRIPRLEREFAENGISEVVYQTVGAGLPDDAVVENCAAIIAAVEQMSQTKREA